MAPSMLELFSGTGSLGDSFRASGWDVVSLDISNKLSEPIFKTDILEWDHTMFPPGYFAFIHASPPCQQYSIARSNARTPVI